jgi:hypothetical protein
VARQAVVKVIDRSEAPGVPTDPDMGPADPDERHP